MNRERWRWLRKGVMRVDITRERGKERGGEEELREAEREGVTVRTER